MNVGRFKVLGMQINDLELDGVEWASPGAGRPMGLAAPEEGPLALLFCMLVVSVLCRIFVRCIPHPPHFIKRELCRIGIRGAQTLLY